MLYCRKHYDSVSRREVKLLLRPTPTVNITVCVFPFFPAVELYRSSHSIFHLSFFSLFDLSLSIFSLSHHLLSFSPPCRSSEMAHCKEQTVCVWDISCWFSGTLAWWMARHKTPTTVDLHPEKVAECDWTTFSTLIVYVLRLMMSSAAPFCRRWNLKSLWVQIESFYPGLFVKYTWHKYIL